jgi:hypothetical protein
MNFCWVVVVLLGRLSLGITTNFDYWEALDSGDGIFPSYKSDDLHELFEPKDDLLEYVLRNDFQGRSFTELLKFDGIPTFMSIQNIWFSSIRQWGDKMISFVEGDKIQLRDLHQTGIDIDGSTDEGDKFYYVALPDENRIYRFPQCNFVKSLVANWSFIKALRKALSKKYRPKEITPKAQINETSNYYYRLFQLGRQPEKLGKVEFMEIFGDCSLKKAKDKAKAMGEEDDAIVMARGSRNGGSGTNDNDPASGDIEIYRFPRCGDNIDDFASNWSLFKATKEFLDEKYRIKSEMPKEQRSEINNYYYKMLQLGSYLDELSETKFMEIFGKFSLKEASREAKLMRKNSKD